MKIKARCSIFSLTVLSGKTTFQFVRQIEKITYHVELKPTAIKDLKNIPKNEMSKIIARLESLEDDMQENVKKDTNFTPEYRMRVGNYRALFEIEDDRVIVYRIVIIQHSYGAWRARKTQSHVDATEQTASRSFPPVIPAASSPSFPQVVGGNPEHRYV